MRMLALTLLLLSVLSAASAQVQQEWVARYDGPASFNDVAYDLKADASGNVYVTGTISADFGTDCVTIKYDTAGNEQWVRTFDGSSHDVGFDIALDDLGNVYVTGSSQGFGADYLTIKYDSLGEQQWIRIYEGPVFEEDVATSIAVDPDGNVYVTGYSTGDGTSLDYATIKYSPIGEEVWVRRFDSGAGEDVAASIAVTASGIVVTGRSDSDYTTIMYDFEGVEQWVRSYDGPGNSTDSASEVKVDAAGNIYVTGMSVGAGTNFDYATIKYDPGGTDLWVGRYDGPSTEFRVDYDYASSLAIDPSGNVFVAGNSADDFATVKYDAAGNEIWVQRYGSAETSENANAIAVDDQGNAYVTGISYGDDVTLYDYATIAYDPSGTTRWVERYNGPGNFYDTPHAIDVDAFGGVYVSGQSGGDGTGLDLATIKYSQTPAAAPGAGVPIGTRAALQLRSEPNPFRPLTTIRFRIPMSEGRSPVPVRLAVYDLQGKEIAVLVEGALPAGDYERELNGGKLASGVYYSMLRVGDASETVRMIRLE